MLRKVVTNYTKKQKFRKLIYAYDLILLSIFKKEHRIYKEFACFQKFIFI
jgi:hypothetical protein